MPGYRKFIEMNPYRVPGEIEKNSGEIEVLEIYKLPKEYDIIKTNTYEKAQFFFEYLDKMFYIRRVELNEYNSFYVNYSLFNSIETNYLNRLNTNDICEAYHLSKHKISLYVNIFNDCAYLGVKIYKRDFCKKTLKYLSNSRDEIKILFQSGSYGQSVLKINDEEKIYSGSSYNRNDVKILLNSFLIKNEIIKIEK